MKYAVLVFSLVFGLAISAMGESGHEVPSPTPSAVPSPSGPPSPSVSPKPVPTPGGKITNPRGIGDGKPQSIREIARQSYVAAVKDCWEFSSIRRPRGPKEPFPTPQTFLKGGKPFPVESPKAGNELESCLLEAVAQ